MRKIKIVADSSADISALSGVDFASAPLKVIAGDVTFTDDTSLDLKGMVEFFDNYKGKSQTSCPNTNDWLTAFGDADDIFCVTITSGLSGSYNSACAAKQMYESENEGKRVFVLDTLSAGPEISLIVWKLEEYVKSGMSYEEICQNIQQYRQNTGLIFMLKSLNNFASNGRVSPVVAKIIGVVGICVVGKASEEGTLEVSHKCRGEARSVQVLAEDLQQLGLRSGKVSIAHCDNEAAAQKLKEILTAKFDTIQVEIHRLRGLCSYYAEKGGMLVGFEKM